MHASELKEKYLAFFESKDHARIPSASLIPENDPTVLFTTAGMHPLVPFLMGAQHPLGTRLCSVQRCLRTGDIDETGDAYHHTYFEMLGNWSLGDYFKKEAITWSHEFLTKVLEIPKERLAVSCFAGDADAPRDDEAAAIWRSLGVANERIAFLPKKNNWWGPAGTTGPCGPDTEMFYWRPNDVAAPTHFDPEDSNWVEIWNDVFMQYDKQEDGSYAPLAQQNVDTGMGVERVTATLQGLEDNYRSELFWPIIEALQDRSGKEYDRYTKEMRIIADHLRSSVFVLGDERGVTPSNVDQGYILRRFIRRAIRHAKTLGIETDFTADFGALIIDMYGKDYPLLVEKQMFIVDELQKEETKFRTTLTKGLAEFAKIASTLAAEGKTSVPAQTAFLLFQSYGFPLEMTQELAKESELSVDEKEFAKEFAHHQELSRSGAEKKFKGGLADHAETTVRMHTATHLLNEALRKVLSPDITQKGSNITAERLRFDFNFARKLTPEEVQAVEDEVNRVIAHDYAVTRTEMSPDEAKAMGAQSEFGARYPERVSVYKIGDYSTEICMGPHVEHTAQVGKFKILKEEGVAAGIRRLKAIVE